MHETYIGAAIDEAEAGVQAGHGGPFGAVIVRDDEIIGRGHNHVTSACDPTAHAEVVAIRDACRRIGSHVLAGTTLYASCEPCPMCLAAIYWARIDRVYFAARSADAAAAGFDDARLYDELRCPREERSLATATLSHPRSQRPFELWLERNDRVHY